MSIKKMLSEIGKAIHAKSVFNWQSLVSITTGMEWWFFSQGYPPALICWFPFNIQLGGEKL